MGRPVGKKIEIKNCPPLMSNGPPPKGGLNDVSSGSSVGVLLGINVPSQKGANYRIQAVLF